MSLKEQRFSPGKTREPTVSYPQRTRCQTRGQKWADMQEIRLEEGSPTGTVWRKLGEVARVVRTCLKGQRATGKTGESPKKCHGMAGVTKAQCGTVELVWSSDYMVGSPSWLNSFALLHTKGRNSICVSGQRKPQCGTEQQRCF